jgi:hypothetical protein
MAGATTIPRTEETMHRSWLIACVILACTLTGQATTAEPAPDPWHGKTRSDVLTLLGEATKTKESADGRSVLIYKLLRLHEGAVAPTGMTILDVPGIGIVGQMQQPGALKGGEVDILPTETDKQGRGTGGGLTEEEKLTISWDPDTKKTERSWDDRPAIRGKLTLQFRLTPTGEIESWAVSPKKAAKAR